MNSRLPALRITDAFSFGEEGEGKWLVIECADTAGQRFTLRIPHQIELAFFARFQAASIVAAGKRGSVPDREIESAMFVERVTFVPEAGKVCLKVHLAMGMVLDMTLTDEAVAHLRQALGDLNPLRKAGNEGQIH